MKFLIFFNISIKKIAFTTLCLVFFFVGLYSGYHKTGIALFIADIKNQIEDHICPIINFSYQCDQNFSEDKISIDFENPVYNYFVNFDEARNKTILSSLDLDTLNTKRSFLKNLFLDDSLFEINKEIINDHFFNDYFENLIRIKFKSEILNHISNFYFVNHKKNNLIIYAGGSLNIKKDIEFIKNLAGLDVDLLLFDNIGYGESDYPKKFNHEVLGNLDITQSVSSFNLFQILGDKYFPLKFNRIDKVLEYILKDNVYENIVMTGYSGGGSTTLLYSAIDERINLSVPVACCYPYELLFFNEISDGFIEYNPYLSSNVSHYQLYALNGFPKNKKNLIHINLKYDDTTFMGSRYKSYFELLNNKKEFNYNFIIDEETFKHEYSRIAISKIEQFLK